jgi:phospholipid/cholesterol/gamma-HCH transport system permease protein
MDTTAPTIRLEQGDEAMADLIIGGNWTLGAACPGFGELQTQLERLRPGALRCETADLGEWDSALLTLLLRCHDYCSANAIEFDFSAIPEGARKLLQVATAVKAIERSSPPRKSLLELMDPRAKLTAFADALEEFLGFIGDVSIAFARLLRGRANMRRVDLLTFIYQAGPNAFGIITLTSFLVGMILAYLGAAQLAQFGAQIYVADLVTVGMLREMGALMTAVVMAGRTGAAYAAQLGTMQTNEEIDAITTLGISPIEFLVLPRILALVVIMPLLVLYANTVGILGGAVVAMGMDVTLTQFLVQFEKVLSFNHLAIGLFKSFFFALLIAIAGCRAGIQCGRNSAAVGQAATNAVVTSIVYLIVADAAFNILFQKLGI